MHFTYTIYPKGPNTTVGWYLYDRESHPRTQLAGLPNTPLKDFQMLIDGTKQYAEFIEGCGEFGLTPYLTQVGA